MAVSSSDDRGPFLVRLCVVMIVIEVLAIGLRFWSRAILLRANLSKHTRFWWDDWMALLTLPFSLAQSAVGLYWISIGLGKHVSQVSDGDLTKGLTLLYATYPLYDLAISLPKLSALFFYARVFTTHGDSWFTRSLWATGALVIAWLIFAIPSSIFQCTPVSKAWYVIVPGHCINLSDWWLGSAISSVIIDFIILILPLPVLWRLQLRPLRKCLVTAVLICGYCVIMVSIGRLVSVTRAGQSLDEDITYNIVPTSYWLAVEAPISVLSICLPGIFSLVKRGVEHGPYSLLTSRDVAVSHSNKIFGDHNVRAHRNRNQHEAVSGHHYSISEARLKDEDSAVYAVTASEASYPTKPPQANGQEDIPMNTIRVQNDVDISSQA